MPDILREHFQIKQTIVTISARERRHIEAAKKSIKEQRKYLEDFIEKDPFFMLTLDPYDLRIDDADDAPDIVKEMARAGREFDIGPLSAVAGTIAKFAVLAMMDAGADYAFVDNGGDIAIVNDQAVLVGIYAGSSPICDLALEIPSRCEILGICTSSGTVGPSISFGHADAATVISKDPSLADAAATALGNAVPVKGSLEECFRVIERPGIKGALVIRGEEMALWGDVPELRRAKGAKGMITKG